MFREVLHAHRFALSVPPLHWLPPLHGSFTADASDQPLPTLTRRVEVSKL